MSITVETAKDHAKDPAVLCCRAEAGIIIQPENLEDPALFADLEDSGLLKMPEDCLTIEQVLGAKLTKTLDALIPLTPDALEGVNQTFDSKKESSSTIKEESEDNNQKSTEIVQPVISSHSTALGTQTLKLSIAKGEGIELEIPLSIGGVAVPQTTNQEKAANVTTSSFNEEQMVTSDKQVETKKIRSLIKKHFKIDKVDFADETKIEGTTLFLRNAEEICGDAVKLEELVEHMKLEIITPENYDVYSETIMDVQPIATKEEGDLGHGITRVIDGAVMILTGTDANGVQIGEFGSSEGELDRNIMWNRPGAPDKGEIFIKAQVTIKAGTNMERSGPLAAHKAADAITEEIRKALKQVDDSLVVNTEEIVQYRRKGNKKVLIIKEIMGQGAMHDNLIMPVEPVGTLGAKPNVDLGNLPVMLAPTEVLDGGIHALTCIGPASKECSRHYFREPLVQAAMADEEIDLVGVVFVGSPQANSEKFYVSKRLGMMIEAMDLDGAIVTTEGFGNNHIDFASHIEEIGSRDVEVVGVTYSAMQGALVVGNKYMKHMIDNNKSMQGIENEILANNTLCEEDAIRALSMLKTALSGEEIKTAERKWNPNVKLNNVEAIEKATGKKITLADNEQVLPKSKKRIEIYEK
ncbi:D-proline reductase (dithiol) proprotein PrdA [Enterococcus rivorum]|uniref:D-proline reductase (Dithiol) proprotein PrdA n=1 Tax=Enterococcus rivorum TaxID=762845 RepID=A0A1E5KW35_9ENTE|nr:D-proline reductase (dithiol) proprotein PrdA [Enterococcus rivorum]MBP2100306.1 D-proline reductase (dithiol) PrdA [Enterococcus rivorum]OEH82028.1 D-proline reductase (dithiol) proprotein PrdA [Enterococcus rivorum]